MTCSLPASVDRDARQRGRSFDYIPPHREADFAEEPDDHGRKWRVVHTGTLSIELGGTCRKPNDDGVPQEERWPGRLVLDSATRADMLFTLLSPYGRYLLRRPRGWTVEDYYSALAARRLIRELLPG